jgi:hypothetical protein
MSAPGAVLLINAKFPHNVGAALRACAAFGAERLAWTPDRVPSLDDWPPGQRLPREERMMKAYQEVGITNPSRVQAIDEFTRLGYRPVPSRCATPRSHFHTLNIPPRPCTSSAPRTGHSPEAT